MIFKSEIVTQVSGSIGGVTYSHGRSGLERKARRQHVDPSTDRQLAVRAVFVELAHAWANELTEAQRTGWRNYAAGTPVDGKLSDRLLLSGHQMYGRCNGVRLAGGVARVDEAPQRPGLATMTGVVVIPGTGPNLILVATTVPEEWRDNDGGVLVVQTTQYVTASRTRNTRGFRQLGAVFGNTAAPPASSFFAPNGFGQNVMDNPVGTPIGFRIVASSPDGRISRDETGIVTTV